MSALAFDPGEKLLAAATADGAAFVWGVEDGREVSRKPEDRFAPITALEFSPDGRALYVGYLMGALEKRPATDLRNVLATQLVHRETVDNLAADASGRLLASSSSDNSVILWDAETLEPFGDLARDDELLIRQLVFDATGGRLAMVMQDGTVRLWDVDVESWHRRARQLANRELSTSERIQYGLEILDSTIVGGSGQYGIETVESSDSSSTNGGKFFEESSPVSTCNVERGIFDLFTRERVCFSRLQSLAFSTLKVMESEVSLTPKSSNAIAFNVCLPAGTFLQLNLNVSVTISDALPISFPSA